MKIGYWWIVSGLVFLILESFFPAYLFLNLAVGGFVLGFILLVIGPFSFIWQILFWGLFSGISLYICLIKFRRKGKKEVTGMEEIYFGKIARSTEEITAGRGRLTIYGEAWEARSITGKIPQGKQVRIKHLDGLVFVVEEIVEE